MSQLTQVRVPDIGDFKNVPIIEIQVKPGDRVAAETPLITLESDKASMEIPSPSAGTVNALAVKLGDKVSEGTPISRWKSTAPPPRRKRRSPPYRRLRRRQAHPLALPRSVFPISAISKTCQSSRAW